MAKHYCSFEENKEYGYCEENQEGEFDLTVFDEVDGSGIKVKYCPFCGDMAPKYLKICEVCGVTQAETKDSFWGYWFNGRDHNLCGICRKKLDVLVDNAREKAIKDFIGEKITLDEKLSNELKKKFEKKHEKTNL